VVSCSPSILAVAGRRTPPPPPPRKKKVIGGSAGACRGRMVTSSASCSNLAWLMPVIPIAMQHLTAAQDLSGFTIFFARD